MDTRTSRGNPLSGSRALPGGLPVREGIVAFTAPSEPGEAGREASFSPGERPPEGEDQPALSVEQVVRDFGPRVYRVVRKMVSNETDAEDVTQDVLLQVVRKFPSFRGESAFPTWLHRVTVNMALSYRRKQALNPEHAGSEELADLLEEPRTGALSQQNRPDTDLLTREIRHLIDRAIAHLPAAYRYVFILADIEGLANAEVAEHLNLSLPAVKSRLHRARHMMREKLAPHVDLGES
jgi:RNA polymerase sigma-70 factor (ECF subfamily)